MKLQYSDFAPEKYNGEPLLYPLLFSDFTGSELTIRISKRLKSSKKFDISRVPATDQAKKASIQKI